MDDETEATSAAGVRPLAYATMPEGVSAYLWVSLACGAWSFAFVALRWGHFSWPEETLLILGKSCGALGIAALMLVGAAFEKGLRSANARRLGVAAILLGLCGASGAAAFPPQRRLPAKRIICVSCLRQIGAAMSMYASQKNLQGLNVSLKHDADHFLCPTTGELRRVEFPPSAPREGEGILFFERQPEGGANVLFGNGRLRRLDEPELNRRLALQTTGGLRTFEDLLAETPVRMGDWNCRVGMADPGQDAGPVEQVYCLADWVGNGDPGKLSEGGSDALGPLALRVNWDDDKVRVEVKANRSSIAAMHGTRSLFVSSVMLARKSATTLSIMGPGAEKPIWQRRLKLDAPRRSPWQRFGQGQSDRTLDANVAKPVAAVATFYGATPIVADRIEDTHVWKGELPGILHPGTPHLNLNIKDNVFTIDSTDAMMLDWPDQTLLARWWVNGRPVLPPVSQEPGQQSEQARMVSFAKHSELRFGLPTNIGAINLGDTITVQVMYCPGPITAVIEDKYAAMLHHEMSHDGGREFKTPVLSHSLDFKLTPRLLAMVKPAAPSL